MAKDPFRPDVSIVDFDPPAVRRAAPGPEFRRPKRVRQMGQRAEELMALFAAGGIAAVRANLTEAELAERVRMEAVIGSPEKVISPEAFAELVAGIDKDGPAAVIPPQDALERAERAKTVGRITPDDTQ